MSEDPTARPPSPAAYRFGGFELRPRARQLLRGDREIELQGKVFDLIAYLVEHADRAVDKGELLDAVWPRQVVTEAALARCVMKARRALDDDASDPRVLQTVHGRGYRLVVDVETLDQLEAGTTPPRFESPGSRAADAPPDPKRSRARTGSAMRFGVLLALAVLLASVWLLRRAEQATPGPTDLPLRLAILPVANQTGEADLDWAELALMGAIGDVLQLGDGLPVAPAADILPLRASFEELEGRALWLRLNETLGSSHVVQSRLLRQPGQLRLSYLLIGPDGMQRRRTVVAPDVSGLAHAAGNDLLAALGWQRSGEAFSDDAFANEAFLRGRAQRLQGDVPGAAELFRLAIEQVPGAFWPRYELALCLRDLGQPDEALGMLRGLQEQADGTASLEAQLSVRNAQAILLWRTGQHEEAEALLNAALDLAERKGDLNRIASVLTNLGILADFRRQPDRARQFLQRASEASLASGHPAVPGHIRHTLAQIEIDAGQFATADEHLQSALQQFRSLGNRRFEAIALNTLSRLRRRQGRSDEARDLIEQAIAVHRELGARGAEATALQSLASLDAEEGRLADAIAWNDRALRVAEQIEELPRVVSAERLRGELEAGRGDWEAAESWLQRARGHAAGLDQSATLQRIDLTRIDVLLRAQALDDAGSALDALSGTLDESASRNVRRDLCGLEARLQHARGDHAAAQARLEACRAEHGARFTESMRRFEVLLAIELGELDRAATLFEGISPDSLREEAEAARIAARLAAAQGDPKAALAHERRAKDLAGEHWLASDAARLAERELAATP